MKARCAVRVAQWLAYAADIQSGPNLMGSFVVLFRDYGANNHTMQPARYTSTNGSPGAKSPLTMITLSLPGEGRATADLTPDPRRVSRTSPATQWPQR